MPLKEIQKQTDEWVSQYKSGYWKPHENLAQLIEEVGELAREINHRWGQQVKKHGEKDVNLGEELADIIFVVSALANSLNIDLDEMWKRVMDKHWTRDKDRYARK
jgi:NTP pyrophosphatase (non-canonical NTP hydrolase)